MIRPQPFQRRLTVWAVSCLLAAPLLYGVCWLDASLAGDGHLGLGPHPYASADAVRFGLGGLRYLYHGQTLTGPHIGYPLVLALLALNTGLLWLARGWGVRAQWMFRVSLTALLLTLGMGWPTLVFTQHMHNDILATEENVSFSASPVILSTQQYGAEGRGKRHQFPNPTAWGVLGLGLTGAAGLRRGGSPRTRAPQNNWA
ncbi:hypothetical protein [Deinococcus sp.]|uniref:hypothetical protein n=1 Tax=Deinococcus sp. TaxID=47478 RepID=UPI0025BE3AE9|nr:hypothetical protein [Deinococcus sp.]